MYAAISDKDSKENLVSSRMVKLKIIANFCKML